MRRRDLLINNRPIEEDRKLYFQWGDTTGYLSGQCGTTGELKKFYWEDYKFGDGKSSPGATGMTKYNANDSKVTLEQCDDIVRANWGCNWRMPTTDEFVALGDAVNTAWTSDYSGTTTSDGMVDGRDYVEIGGVKWATMNVGATDDKDLPGMVCTAKDGSGKVLFFPAAGYCDDGGFYGWGSDGRYWSSSLYSSNVQSAYRLSFYYDGSVGWQSYNGRYLGFSVRGVTYKNIQPINTKALDVAFYDGNDIVIRSQEDWKDNETPIGIVVVPGSHDRYGDGSCGIMSLVGMSIGTPETGIAVTGASETDNINMYWGHYNALVGNNIFLSTTALTSAGNYIPYQTNSASTACSISSGSIVWPYAGTTTAPTSAASTSYTNTGGYVSATTGKSGCDFNGIRNTVSLYVATSASTQWTASTVSNDYSTGTTGNTPAAACAGRFKTVGTKSFLDVFSGTSTNNINYVTSASTKDNKGFWYLPAEGELCYLPRNKYEINKTILALNQKYGNVGVQLGTSSYYWSSSEFNNKYAYGVTMGDGHLDYYRKDYSSYVRAFMRL